MIKYYEAINIKNERFALATDEHPHRTLSVRTISKKECEDLAKKTKLVRNIRGETSMKKWNQATKCFYTQYSSAGTDKGANDRGFAR